MLKTSWNYSIWKCMKTQVHVIRIVFKNKKKSWKNVTVKN